MYQFPVLPECSFILILDTDSREEGPAIFCPRLSDRAFAYQEKRNCNMYNFKRKWSFVGELGRWQERGGGRGVGHTTQLVGSYSSIKDLTCALSNELGVLTSGPPVISL